eukprot:2077196-Amphidinium_carterae.1
MTSNSSDSSVLDSMHHRTSAPSVFSRNPIIACEPAEINVHPFQWNDSPSTLMEDEWPVRTSLLQKGPRLQVGDTWGSSLVVPTMAPSKPCEKHACTMALQPTYHLWRMWLGTQRIQHPLYCMVLESFGDVFSVAHC